MSKILAKDSLDTQNWVITKENLAPNHIDLKIGFTDEAPIVEFSNLRFGFRLSQGEEVIYERFYPPPNVTYIRTDQEYLVTYRLDLTPDTEYSLFLWAENANTRIEHTEIFETPKPSQPYNSWSWDGEQWVAPVPYPESEKDYAWDENTGDWVETTVEG